MHLILELRSEKKIVLPVHYNHILQGFIYNTINSELADFLHREGYGEKRKFKLFCFSRIFGDFQIDKKSNKIIYNKKISFQISSPYISFCESFANGVFQKEVRLGDNDLTITSIKIDKQEVTGDSIVVDTLSPVVVCSTYIKEDNKKYTVYFEPESNEFKRIVTENLKKKYISTYKEKALDGDIAIEVLGKSKQSILKYKGFVFKGSTGRLKLKGPKELLQIAVDAGIGSRNSMGSGLIRIV